MTEQKFLKELDAKLWKAANKLLPSLDAAVYKHVVLGLVFVKYVSDSFKIRRAELKKAFSDASNEYFLGDDTDEEIIAEELENRDYYTEKNIFWIPQAARWEYIQDYIRLGVGAPMPLGGEFKGAGKLIDDAMELIEKDNPKLKRILNKNYAQLQIEQTKLADLLDLIASIPFSHDSLQSKDILGHVYEYFLGMFAAAEGKKGGQFYTPKSIVNLIVEMVEPYEGRVYDPAMGSGGFFISSEKFIEEHQGKIGNISVYGQESNPTTWRLAAMNMAIRGIDFNFGKEPAGSFTNDQHPDLRADYVLANPPFNQNEDQWWDASLDGDGRWVYGTPPQGNGNYGWMQHMLYHTSPNGVIGLVLAIGSLSSNTGGESAIRKNIIEADLVEAIVVLPSQLFANTQIPACIWILNRNKIQKGKTLFIDTREVGHMVDKKQKIFSDEDVQSLVDTFHSWRSGCGYEDVVGRCYSATTEEIAKRDYVLAIESYVGVEDDKVIPLYLNLAIVNLLLKGYAQKQKRLDNKISRRLGENFPNNNWDGITYSSNNVLEAMAQAIFKSWFVDFNPVYAKANASSGRGLDKLAKELNISREILDLFPSEFDESELGLIPKGWDVDILNNISMVTIGKTPPRKETHWFSANTNNDIKWASIKDMGNCGTYIFNTAECLTQEAIDRFNVKVVPKFTVILSFKLTVGRVSITTEDMCTNEAIAHFELNDNLSTEYLYSHLKAFNYKSLSSTSSIATAVNSKIIKKIPIVIPSSHILNAFNDIIKDIFMKIKLNSSVSQAFQKTRDTLLPKLLSGELDVSELELDNVTN